MESKILKGIKPFNEYVFRSCYYNQLLAVYNYYGIDKRFLLNNALATYKFDDKTKSCKIDFIELFNEKELEEMTSLHLIKKGESKDLRREIIRSINKGCPVMVCVDGFYLPYRQDAYNKIHGSHFILVYGYDSAANEFIINEHMYANSMVYGKYRLNMNTLLLANMKLLKKNNSIVKIIKKDKKAEKFSFKKYKAALFNNRKMFFKSVKNLNKMMNFIVDSLESLDKLADRTPPILDFLEDVKWKKSVEIYNYAFLFKNEKLNETTRTLLNDFVFIFGAFFRLSMTKGYYRESITKIQNKCKEIMFLEQQKNDYLLTEMR